MLRLDKATYLSLIFRYILSERLSNSLWESKELLFLLCLYWIHYIVAYFFRKFFPWCKKCFICLILFIKFSDVLVLLCASAIGNLESICFYVLLFWFLYLSWWYRKYSTFKRVKDNFSAFMKHFNVFIFFSLSWFLVYFF